MAVWKKPYLIETYGERYGWFGETLGNINYKSGGPILLANPKPGIAHLADLLQQGYNLLPFCGCASYEKCHRREVITLLQQAVPDSEIIFPDQIAHTGMVKCLSIRQPWAWLICHPQALQECAIPIKNLENREWTSGYRGPLYIQAGTAVDGSLFDPRSGTLEAWYWERKFGKQAGQALFTSMPRHKDDYPRRAIVGQAQLTDIVTMSRNPWFNGPYGLVLSNAQAITPISYPGQFKIFEIPASILKQTAQ
jgi:hypothetical protein